MAEIVLDRVTKSYPDGAMAVQELSLTIAEGEFIILVGPSGCGKSTTLNMIAGLEDISSGELRIGGERVNEKAPKDRDIAMVFQSYALYPAHDGAAEHRLPADAGEDEKGGDRPRRSRTPREFSTSPTSSTANPRSCPAASVSGSRWGGRSCATPRHF